MPYTKKQVAAARTIQRAARKQFSNRPKRRMMKRKTPLALKPHTFVERSSITTTLTVANEASAAGMIKEFSLNEIPQNGCYVDLFEEYRINKVVASFRYKSTGQYAYETGSAVNMNEINPVLYFKVDHNDENLETLPQLKESSRTRSFQFTNSKPNIDIVLKPACLIDVNNIHGALGVAHRPRWKVWLPTEEGSVSHFGLKAYCVAASSAAHIPGQVEVSYKIYFQCKNND